MKRLFDLRSPFFASPGRRAAAVAVCGGWALYELSQGALFWALLFGAAAAWMAYAFFIAFDPEDYRDKSND